MNKLVDAAGLALLAVFMPAGFLNSDLTLGGLRRVPVSAAPRATTEPVPPRP